MFGDPQKNPTLLPALCLYLIMFAFFILLNAMAQSSTPRLNGVSASLTATFATRGHPTAIPEVSTLQGNRALFEADFIESVGNLVKTAFPVVRVAEADDERQLEARVPASALFDDGSPAPKAEFGPLIARIAVLLREHPPGYRNDVEVLVPGLAARPISALAAEEPLAIARAGRLAVRLREQGAPAGSVAVGLERSTDGWVRFVFRVRPDDEGRIPFTDGKTR
jgi:hypothetical protein